MNAQCDQLPLTATRATVWRPGSWASWKEGSRERWELRKTEGGRRQGIKAGKDAGEPGRPTCSAPNMFLHAYMYMLALTHVCTEHTHSVLI